MTTSTRLLVAAALAAGLLFALPYVPRLAAPTVAASPAPAAEGPCFRWGRAECCYKDDEAADLPWLTDTMP